ncbi:MAG: SRPBCC domain-containing protein [Conexivisphaerales archaeon]|nr:SRPBCC domain-containing protein [Conexivisphaerales archaeon]
MTTLSGKVDLKVPKERVLAFAANPDEFSKVLPNLQEFEKKEEGKFTAKFKAELPPDMKKGLLANLSNVGIKMNFQISTEGDSVAVHGEGRSMGMKIVIDLKMDMTASADGTEIAWNADVDAGMILRMMGEQNFKKVADGIIEQMIGNVKATLETPQGRA